MTNRSSSLRLHTTKACLKEDGLVRFIEVIKYDRVNVKSCELEVKSMIRHHIVKHYL